ncbi:hypothetical protein K437DRAFT_64483 [Tilletiaria anomala UBC 951]|uniref:Uncharacterized protein n=1 Tax=Tilletiaria anomala (strain ATCC 24038 / CBS 436.72 / UBC 951) TaxID=1037660 RepID=A0A066V2M4_TILAU|nr:uncharacterized protein K437DRAFT_64483 [Tilletiaria anomala UBC 951]KDN35947.1 hypothetical protein K437DRAFT_64483 [Tilletiaria anomala UBC 951]
MASRYAPPQPSRQPNVPTPPVRFGADEARTPANSDMPRGVVRSSAKEISSAGGGSSSRKKERGGATKRKASVKGTLFAFLFRVAFFYTLIAAVWNCSSRPFAFDYATNDHRVVCRTLAQTKLQLQPLVLPYVHKLEAKAEPYVRIVRPYVKTAYKHAKPVALYAQWTGTHLYKKHVLPMQKQALRRTRGFADPHISKVQKQYETHVQPRIFTAQRTIQPYHDIYWRDVHPHVQTSYDLVVRSVAVSSTFYLEQVYPQIITLSKHSYRFYVDHASPAIYRFYAALIRPQVDKLLAKLWNARVRQMTDEVIDATRLQADAVGTGQSYESEKVKKVEGAVKKAKQARDDHSVLGRLSKTSEAVHGKEQSDDTAVAAERAVRVEAESAVLTEKLELWETGLGELIRKEFKLWTERVAQARNHQVAELPQQFAALVDAFVDEEAGVALVRLERGFKRLALERDARPLDERLAAAQQLIAKEESKLFSDSAKLRSGLAALKGKLVNTEVSAAHASADEIDRYVDAAIKSFESTMGKTEYHENVDDWEGWDAGLKVRANMYREELLGVQKGERPVKSGLGINLKKEPDVSPHNHQRTCQAIQAPVRRCCARDPQLHERSAVGA